MSDKSIFLKERAAFLAEFNHYYQQYPINISDIIERLNKNANKMIYYSPYREKALIYEIAASDCEVHIFRHCPFYYEIKTGRLRNSWGFSGIGSWMKERHNTLEKEFFEWQKDYSFIKPNSFVDLDHNSIGYDNILKYGLLGFIKRAQQRLLTVKTEREKEFLKSTITANQALITIANKFSRKAFELATDEQDPVILKRLTKIAETAKRVPAEPPKTFYEALNTIIFIREASSSLEGIGVSILGHLDRLLEEYYLNDLKSGRITREEAKDLLSWFLSLTDARWDLRNDPWTETSTTIVIGGQNKNGGIIFNEITRMIIEIYEELGLLNPKLNARISAEHPEEYYSYLARLTSVESNTLAIFNDDVIIKASQKQGKSLAESRLYVAGGCQEIMLQNSETNCKAYCYLNLPRIFNIMIYPEQTKFWEREGIKPENLFQLNTFAEFYQSFLINFRQVIQTIICKLYFFESKWWEFNPCPLHSSTVSNCIDNAKDMTEGGAMYNSNSLSLVGIGTLIDSLYTIKQIVYEKNKLCFSKLKEIVNKNYEDEEYLHQYLLNRLDKYGQDKEQISQFAGRVFADIAGLVRGYDNPRGGKFEASLFSYYTYKEFGQDTEATFDGRKAGSEISRGMSPGNQSQIESVSSLIKTLDMIDLTDYAGGGVLYLDLPYTQEKLAEQIIGQVIHGFLTAGGSILQLNIVDKQKLIAAQKDPDKYQNLVVRVCGYSAYFTSLETEVQSEIINRAEIG